MLFNLVIPIISSSDSTDNFKKYLQAGADFVILGEGEMTLLELMTSLTNKTSYQNLEGIAYLADGEVVNFGKRPVMRNLDLLPFPAWDLVDAERYRKLWVKKQGYFSLNLATSRGCTYKCNWCAKPIFGNRYNVRSPENILAELKTLVQVFGADHIWFCDDIFGLKPGWIAQFADLIESENLKFKFKIQSRADLLLDEQIVKDLARAGCYEIWIGAESGSQKILDAMDKGITVEQIYKSRFLLRKYGIRAAFFLQFGYPGETKQDIDKTIQMVVDLMPEEIGISVSYPLPGTKFYDSVKGELMDKTNWKDSDEMAMMFQHAYPENYYRELQRYVHRVYRYNKNVSDWKENLHQRNGISRNMIRKVASIPYNFALYKWYKLKLKI